VLMFESCVFSGAVCTACGASFDPGEKEGSRTLEASVLKKHWEKKHRDMEFDKKTEFARVKESLEATAHCLSLCASDERRAQVCKLYLKSEDLTWCSAPGCRCAYRNGHPTVTKMLNCTKSTLL